MNQFIKNETPKLIEMIALYLSQEITHDVIYEYAWGLVEQEDKASESHEEFWSCVFSIIHLADEQHWEDGCTQTDLKFLKEKLEKAT